MATKSKVNTNKMKVMTNGAISLIVALSVMIGALSGYLIAYLTIK